jgi:hypothetical protein
MAGCSSARISSCISAPSSAPAPTPMSPPCVVIGIEPGWTKKIVDGIAPPASR